MCKKKKKKYIYIYIHTPEMDSFVCWLRAQSRLLLNCSGDGQPRSQAVQGQSLSQTWNCPWACQGGEAPLTILQTEQPVNTCILHLFINDVC